MRLLQALLLTLVVTTSYAQEWMPITLNDTPSTMAHSSPHLDGYSVDSAFAYVNDTLYFAANSGRNGTELYWRKGNAEPELLRDFLLYSKGQSESDDVELVGNIASSYPQLAQCSNHAIVVAAESRHTQNGTFYAKYSAHMLDGSATLNDGITGFETSINARLVTKIFGTADIAVYKAKMLDNSDKLYVYSCDDEQFQAYTINNQSYSQITVSGKYYFFQRVDYDTNVFYQVALDLMTGEEVSIAVDSPEQIRGRTPLSVDGKLLYTTLSDAPEYSSLFLFWQPGMDKFQSVTFTKDNDVEPESIVENVHSRTIMRSEKTSGSGWFTCQGDEHCFFVDIDNLHISKTLTHNSYSASESPSIWCPYNTVLEDAAFCLLAESYQSDFSIIKITNGTSNQLTVQKVTPVENVAYLVNPQGSTLYWFMDDAIHGIELYSYDLTGSAGQQLHDINDTLFPSEPILFTQSGDETFFAANIGNNLAMGTDMSELLSPVNHQIFSIDKNHVIRQVSELPVGIVQVQAMAVGQQFIYASLIYKSEAESMEAGVFQISKLTGESQLVYSVDYQGRESVNHIFMTPDEKALLIKEEYYPSGDDEYSLIEMDAASGDILRYGLIIRSDLPYYFDYRGENLFWHNSQTVSVLDFSAFSVTNYNFDSFTSLSPINYEGDRIDDYYLSGNVDNQRYLLTYAPGGEKDWVVSDTEGYSSVKRQADYLIFYSNEKATIKSPHDEVKISFERQGIPSCIGIIDQKLVTFGRIRTTPNASIPMLQVYSLTSEEALIQKNISRELYNCTATGKGFYGNVKQELAGLGIFDNQDEIGAVELPPSEVLSHAVLSSHESDEESGAYYVLEKDDTNRTVIKRIHTLSGSGEWIWHFRKEFVNPQTAKLGENTYGVFGLVDGYDRDRSRFQLRTYNVITNENRVYTWPANWQSAKLLLLPDSDGDGLLEPALTGRYAPQDNRPQVSVLSSVTGDETVRISYPPLFTSHTFYPVADHNGDGIGDIALLGVLARNGNIQGKVDSGYDGERLLNLNFPAKWKSKSLVPLDDIHGDGVRDFGLFAKNQETKTTQLIVKGGTAETSDAVIFTWPEDLEKTELLELPDINGDGVSEVAVFGRNTSTDRLQLIIKSGASTSDLIASVGWGNRFVSYELTSFYSEKHGVIYALMGVTDTGKYQVEVKNSDNEKLYKGFTTEAYSEIPVVKYVDDTYQSLVFIGEDSDGTVMYEYVDTYM